jgi:hypothetical protein
MDGASGDVPSWRQYHVRSPRHTAILPEIVLCPDRLDFRSNYRSDNLGPNDYQIHILVYMYVVGPMQPCLISDY